MAALDAAIHAFRQLTPGSSPGVTVTSNDSGGFGRLPGLSRPLIAWPAASIIRRWA